jgi:hypothetical protein
MLDRREYLNLKKEIKCLCRKNVVTLCDEMELNEEERNLLLYFYDGKSRIETSIDLHISIEYYTEHMKILFNKIYDYKNTFK